MQTIEPTGVGRIEHYLAQILAALLNQGSGKPYDPFQHLIGYEPREMSMEEQFRAFCAVETAVKSNGDTSKP